MQTKKPLTDAASTDIATWNAHNKMLLDGGEGKTQCLSISERSPAGSNHRTAGDDDRHWRRPNALASALTPPAIGTNSAHSEQNIPTSVPLGAKTSWTRTGGDGILPVPLGNEPLGKHVTWDASVGLPLGGTHIRYYKDDVVGLLPPAPSRDVKDTTGLHPPTLNYGGVVGAQTPHLRRLNKSAHIKEQTDQVNEPDW